MKLIRAQVKIKFISIYWLQICFAVVLTHFSRSYGTPLAQNVSIFNYSLGAVFANIYFFWNFFALSFNFQFRFLFTKLQNKKRNRFKTTGITFAIFITKFCIPDVVNSHCNVVFSLQLFVPVINHHLSAPGHSGTEYVIWIARTSAICLTDLIAPMNFPHVKKHPRTSVLEGSETKSVMSLATMRHASGMEGIA